VGEDVAEAVGDADAASGLLCGYGRALVPTLHFRSLFQNGAT